MSAPIPKGKWSWKASRCKICGTRSKTGKHKHKGNGLCLSCFDKKRLENPKRKENVKNAQLRFFQKNRYKDWFRKKNRKAVKKYLDKMKDNPEFITNRRKRNNKRYYKIKNNYWFKKGTIISQRKQREKKYFKEFINGNPKYLKKFKGGIKYKCNGCSKECLITSPINPKNIKNELKRFERFKKIVIENCKR